MEYSYRVYITDSIRAAGERKYLRNRWADLIHPPPVDRRTGNEIAADIIKRAGLTITGE